MPIFIPGTGGTVEFDITVANIVDSVIVIDAWTEIDLPTGGTVSPLILRTITLPVGGIVSRTLTQNVPASAPAGYYSYIAKAGVYPATVHAWDSFSFGKIGDDSGTGQIHDWSISGWDLEQPAPPIAANEYNLSSAYPNPFNPETTISYALPQNSKVQLTVYDLTGSQITTLVDGWRSAGMHEVTFDGSNLASGVYLYRLEAGDFHADGKMILMK